VLGEVLDVFPGEHVHIGGDECPETEWAASPVARRRIADEGLAGPHELRAWFLRRVGDFLLANGRVPIVWDETGDGPDLDPRTVVMPWRDAAHARASLERGHPVVLTPWRSTYLDHPESTDPGEPVVQPAGTVTVHDVYHQELPSGDAVLGSQCQLWTEQVARAEDAEYLAFPRLCALADALWSDRPDWAAFTAAMPAHERRLAALSVRHRPLTAVP